MESEAGQIMKISGRQDHWFLTHRWKSAENSPNSIDNVCERGINVKCNEVEIIWVSIESRKVVLPLWYGTYSIPCSKVVLSFELWRSSDQQRDPSDWSVICLWNWDASYQGTILAVSGLVRLTSDNPPRTVTMRLTPSICILLTCRLPFPCCHNTCQRLSINWEELRLYLDSC